jgi:hypothetical protein
MSYHYNFIYLVNAKLDKTSNKDCKRDGWLTNTPIELDPFD